LLVMAPPSQELEPPINPGRFNIITYGDGEMVVRSTTHHMSPLSLNRMSTGQHFPLLSTAAGMVYLAFSEPAARKAILAVLGPNALIPEHYRMNPKFDLEKELQLTRKRGYGIRLSVPRTRTASIALPILQSGQVLGALSIIWIDSALTLDQAVRDFLPVMEDAVRKIEQGCQKYFANKTNA
jgi:IclR family transcriptional regulator, mhp operon transcriptional activator